MGRLFVRLLSWSKIYRIVEYLEELLSLCHYNLNSGSLDLPYGTRYGPDVLGHMRCSLSVETRPPFQYEKRCGWNALQRIQASGGSACSRQSHHCSSASLCPPCAASKVIAAVTNWSDISSRSTSRPFDPILTSLARSYKILLRQILDRSPLSRWRSLFGRNHILNSA